MLVIAFTGFRGGLTMSTFDFLAVTKLTKYNRILLLDRSQTCYLGGIPPLLADHAALLAFLRGQVAQFAPEKILCIGASSGAYAALLFGHALRADYVHAFSPYSYVDRANGEKLGDQDGLTRQADTIARIEALGPGVRPLLDLLPVLMQDNGKTRYYIHACKNSPWDMLRATRLMNCPGVLVFGYPCGSHGVASTLARGGLLEDLLKLENQDQMARRIDEAIVRLRARAGS